MITKSWSPEAANSLLRNLSPEEQAKVVEYGAMLRLADLRRQLLQAQTTIKELGAKYQTTLTQLSSEGLPDDAGYEMHEDYILWHHYTEKIVRLEKSISVLEEGLRPPSLGSDAS